MLSPILYAEKQWQELVLREFALLPNLERIDFYKERFVSILNELRYRTGRDTVPLFIEVLDSINNNPFFQHSTFLPQKGVEGFKVDLSECIDFISSITKEKVKDMNLDLLVEKIIAEEKRKQIILQRIQNSKIELHKNQNHVAKGFCYLLQKANPSSEARLLKLVANQLMSELFHTKRKPSAFLIPEHIQFGNQLLLEYLLFLEKQGYIEYNGKVSIPKIVAQNCSLQMKGLTQSNLYNILKTKLSYHPDNVDNIKLTFMGLTGEIALLNEMKN